MLESTDISNILGAVRSASAMTENTFLRIGQALEASTEILSSLTSSFETALTELKDRNLTEALLSLGEAAGRVAMLGSNGSVASIKFGEMERVAAAIAERIAKMNRSVGGANALAINSKIASASIRGSTMDFTEFADEIARTLGMTRSCLDSFGSGLQSVRSHVGAAFAGQLAFEKGQSDATRSIPARLTATVNSMPLQHRRNAQAITAVRLRSERMRQQVRSAISGLQAGDMTRQRLEHVDYAIGLLAPPLDSALTEPEQRDLTIATCRLEAAQLAATLEEFERNVSQISASLHSMANEARVLRTLANSTYGSAAGDQGTFIGDLELQVGGALSLFENYGTAWLQAADAMRTVSEAAEGLCGHLRIVQSLEDDIRIMGLNTTLKCARLGPEGRALGLIAQELRAYGNDFAREASALIGEVEQLTKITASFVSSEPDAVSLVTTVMEAMKQSLASLRQVGQTLDNTLATLERDSERVIGLLENSAAELAGNDGIGQALRLAAENLRAVAPSDAMTVHDLAPRALQMLETIARTYTMATERVVHERILGQSAASAGVPVPVARAVELEDMLF